MRLHWTIGTYPIFIGCAICGRTILYPFNTRLVKGNFCILRHRAVRPDLKKKIQQIYRIFFHQWQLVGLHIPYNLNEPTLYKIRGWYPNGYKEKSVEKWGRDKEWTEPLIKIAILRNILRGKTVEGNNGKVF